MPSVYLIQPLSTLHLMDLGSLYTLKAKESYEIESTYGESLDNASCVVSDKYPKGAEIGISTAFRSATASPTVVAYVFPKVIVIEPNGITRNAMYAIYNKTKDTK